MAKLRTVLGDVEVSPLRGLGESGQVSESIMLPHEHLFCDLRALAEREPIRDDPDQVEAAELPLLREAREAGVDLLLEPTPPGIGRDALLYRRLAEHSYINVIAATGLYKEPLLPRRAYERTEDDLASWMAFEISVGILPVAGDSLYGESLLSEEALGRATDALNETPVRAGVIKLAASDAGLQAVEAKALRAAILAARETGVAIVSHCPSGASFQQQLDVLEAAGGDPARFVQVHANSEQDFELHLRALQRGAWLEYDGIGRSEDVDARHLDLIQRVIRAGFTDRLLLSQDVVGWRAAAPGGGNYETGGGSSNDAGSAGTSATSPSDQSRPKRRYAHLVDTFLPRMREAGITEEIIHQLVVDNPRRLFALTVD